MRDRPCATEAGHDLEATRRRDTGDAAGVEAGSGIGLADDGTSRGGETMTATGGGGALQRGKLSGRTM